MKRRAIILADTRNLGKCSCFPRFLVICGDSINVAHDFNVRLDDQFATVGKVLCADQFPNLLTAPVDVELLNTEDIPPAAMVVPAAAALAAPERPVLR